MLVARRSGERFRLGDRLIVEATNVSLQRRQITFALVERLTRDATAPKVDRRGAAASKPRPAKERSKGQQARAYDRTPRGRDDAKVKKVKKVKKAKMKGKLKARAQAKIGKRREPRRPAS